MPVTAKKFINSVINDFENINTRNEDDLIIPEWLFDNRRFIAIKVPFCEKNEAFAKRFLTQLNNFTNDNFKPVIIWKTSKIRSLFSVKDKTIHTSNVVYKCTCSCNEQYIGETDRNSSIRWSEHNNPTHNSDPAKHISEYLNHIYEWDLLSC